MKDNLPDFAHAFVDDVMLGPRRELTLIVRPLIWTGSKGSYGEPVRVRFGGIFDFEEVQTFFADAPHKGSELAWLRYAETTASKPGHLFFDLVFERIEARIGIACGSLTIDGQIVTP